MDGCLCAIRIFEDTMDGNELHGATGMHSPPTGI